MGEIIYLEALDAGCVEGWVLDLEVLGAGGRGTEATVLL